MPHQLRLGLRAVHNLLELGQERLRGRLVTELQIDEDLVRPSAQVAAHGPHRLAAGPRHELRYCPGAAVDTAALTGHRAQQSAPARTRQITRTRTCSASLTGQAQQDTRSTCA